MIARHEEGGDRRNVWGKLREPMPPHEVQWRIDGRPKERDGQYFARVVAYCDVPAVIRRLDEHVPGEWDFTATPIEGTGADHNGEVVVAVRGRLQVLGVIREDVGQGRDFKAACTDALKRAARLFGIALELWEMEGPLWVRVSDDSKFAKITEDCNAAYKRKFGRDPGYRAQIAEANGEDVDAAKPDARAEGNGAAGERATNGDSPASRTESGSTTRGTADVPPCPVCGGRMWDNRETKKNPKAPDFKCRDRNCDGVIWPPKPARGAATATARTDAGPLVQDDDLPPPIDEVPF